MPRFRFVAILALLFLCSSHSLFPESNPIALIPVTFTEARDLYRLGHRSFARLDYPAALDQYGRVECFLERHPEYAASFDHRFRGFSMKEMVARHQALGRTQPKTRHRLLAIYIQRTEATLDGRPVRAECDDDLIETFRLSQSLTRLYLEVMSGGSMSLDLQELRLPATLTELSSSVDITAGRRTTLVQGVIESIRPYPGEPLLTRMASVDTFLFCWNDGGLKTDGEGGAKALGGIAALPFIPDVLMGPERGRIILSAALGDRPGTVFHELFHTLENVYGIQPIHGFRDEIRKAFPAYNGQSEFAYYAWQFSNTILPAGTSQFELARRFPNPVTYEHYHRLLTLSSNLDSMNRSNARTLFSAAVSNQRCAPELAESQFRDALAQNPFLPQALLHFGSWLHLRGKRDLAGDYLFRAHNASPADPEACYWMAVTLFRQRRWRESLAHLDTALCYRDGNARYLTYRAAVYSNLGEMDKAEADLRAAGRGK